MSSRAAQIRDRLLVGLAAFLLAWLFDPTTTLGALMAIVAIVAVLMAFMRWLFGGVPVLYQWLWRYRGTGIGLRELGDIIGEHKDDMRRAGLLVRQGTKRRWRHPERGPKQMPDLYPKLRHRPVQGGMVIHLTAVRAGMAQDDILAALPRLRSAWGVDRLEGRALPGGRTVEFTIALEETFDDRDLTPTSPREPGRSHRPPDEPPVQLVHAGENDGHSMRSRQIAVRGGHQAPATIQPLMRPDHRGRYQIEVLPEEAARTFSPHVVEEASTDEIPIVGGHRHDGRGRPGHADHAPHDPARRSPQPARQRNEEHNGQLERPGQIGNQDAPRIVPPAQDPPGVPRTQATDQVESIVFNGNKTSNPTDVDISRKGMSAIWKTGRED